ncbi:cytochrome c biogenesis heme-transporting ATPase CcmA [Alteromonas sp. C1M14]|uniref:cytochrome c biogenesis heme-transporting ATPase CcmA n=1 Tax=Alteromonas sp. C1M14 TaxID=2841567 RepID=UPI001C088276|nr:cytochrome c biogenesis heme-transporting ATPase CcmA [Alteromonas sp. C1M14]MBU2977815.1 cytochrome c biogenesis heme-transporting ATPase CcmA [Alteromonas sp. C1M14]
MSELVATDLCCIKRDRTLFDGLSLTLHANQLIYLRGPNGAGKTSLLRILSGLSEPERGTITWAGEPLGTNWFTQMLYVGHKLGLNGALSAVENLRFWCFQHRLSATLTHIMAVLLEVGLVGLEDIPCRMLSAGQQRRVALARLYLKPAHVWLLDEPFTALDIAGVQQLEDKMGQHVENGGAIITTSHQPLSTRVGPIKYVDLEYQI